LIARWIRPDTWSMLAIVAVVLLANVPYIIGLGDPNPLGPRSQIDRAKPGLIAGANTLDPTDGYITQALGHLAASNILHGHLPWWNPYEGAGAPLMAEGQSAALFPPTLLLALNNGQFYEDILFELIGGLATFLVLRRIGASCLAATAGGAAFAVNGAVAWLAITASNPIAFLPLLVLGIEYAYSAALARRRGGWWLIAVALALSLYAGFPETAYIDALVAAAWFGWRCGCAPTHLRRLALKGFAGAAVGMLLAAPFWVLFVSALPHEYVGFHNGAAGSITMPHLAFPQLLLPYVYGPLLGFNDPAGNLGTIWGYAGGFVPISLVFLATVSLASRERRGLKVVLLIWVLLALSKVYGQPPVVRHVLLLLPGATSVAFYRYSFGAIAFAISVLAALGIDDVRTRLTSRRAVAAIAAATLGLVAVLTVEAQRLISRLNGGSSPEHWAAAQIVFGVAAILLVAGIALWGRSWKGWVLAAIVVLDAGAMFMLREFSAPRSVHLDRAPLEYLQRHLGSGRFFTLGPLAPNYGAYWRLASLNDVDLPLPKAWTSYVTSSLDNYVNPVFFVGNGGGGRAPSVPTPERELLAHLSAYRDAGVSYVLTSPGQVLALGRTFSLVVRTPTAWIYRLSDAAPYFAAPASCRVRQNGRESVRLSCSRSATLLRRELLFPGWTATVDGGSTALHRSHRIYQSVQVPPGTHTVSFTYTPPGLGWAIAGFVAGCLWFVLGLWRMPLTALRRA
jgi:hypothetical protein